MEYFSSSPFDPFCPQTDEEILFETPCIHHSTHELLQAVADQGDQIIPTSQQDNDNDDDLDHLLAQIPHFSQEEEEEDHQCHHELKDDSNNNNNKNHNQHGQRRKASSTVHDDDDHENNEKKKKQRIMHREVERQRRLEMSSLHTSLRTLLPLEFIKGKRSMSDHLDVATKYISHLQQKMQVLSEKRDGLKLEVCNSNYEVTVNPWNNGGVEVTVCTSSSGQGQGLPLSRVLQCLAKQGLDVVSCISNRVSNDKLVHSIQAQAGDERSTAIDPQELQQKLAEITN